jgi:hypothetical protein
METAGGNEGSVKERYCGKAGQIWLCLFLQYFKRGLKIKYRHFLFHRMVLRLAR